MELAPTSLATPEVAAVIAERIMCMHGGLPLSQNGSGTSVDMSSSSPRAVGFVCGTWYFPTIRPPSLSAAYMCGTGGEVAKQFRAKQLPMLWSDNSNTAVVSNT